MSQIFPNPANKTPKRRGINARESQPVLSKSYVSEKSPLSNDPLPANPNFSPEQVEHPKNYHHWWQKLSFRSKAVAIVITVSALTGLVLGTVTYFISRQTTVPSSQTEQVEANNPTEIEPVPPKQLSLILIIETVVAVLLLVGLLAAYLANRAGRSLTAAASTDEESAQDQAIIEPISDEKLTEEKPGLLAPPSATSNQEIINQLISQEDEEEAELAQLLAQTSIRFRQSISLEDLFRTTVKEVRRILKAERVFFYRFNPDWSGFVVAESVAPGLPSCLNIKVTDTYFSESNAGVEKYKNGRVCVTDDIHQADLEDCHISLLEQFAIKAQMIAPILKDNQLFGLLIANQCSSPRTWHKLEIDLFTQLATQVGLATDQVNLLEQQEEEAERVGRLREISFRLRESQNVEDLLKITVKEVRQAIRSDRVIVYGIDSNNGEGIVVAESVAPGLPQTLKVRINDPSFINRYTQTYQKGDVYAINNIYQEPGLDDSYIKTLEQFAVKAYLVAPILKNDQLLGLLIAHQCLEPRTWQKQEVEFFKQVAIQVGLTIDQVNLLEQIR